MPFQLKLMSDQMQEMPQGKEYPRNKIEGSKLLAVYQLALVLCVCVWVCVCMGVCVCVRAHMALAGVGREQISQAGIFRLLSPMFDKYCK